MDEEYFKDEFVEEYFDDDFFDDKFDEEFFDDDFFSSFSNAERMCSLWLQIRLQESDQPNAPYVFVSTEPYVKEEMGYSYKSTGQESDAK